MNFLSDNASAAHPAILDALIRVNEIENHGYGDESETRRLKTVLSDVFETQVWVYPVVTGTAANALTMATLCPPHGAIVCHSDAHLETDECGAPEFFTSGSKVKAIPGEGGKLTPDALDQTLGQYHDMVHMVVPSVLSITQSTEWGLVYSSQEVSALCDIAKRNNLFCHMDGARFANAVAHLNAAPSQITWRSGIDVLSFGATKNGAIAAEAVVFFNEELVRDFEFRRKRSGHLLSKQHYVSAQLNAYLEDGLWLDLARHSNAAASQIADAAGLKLHYPAQANEVFVGLSADEKSALRAQGFAFYDWGAKSDDLARFVMSWTTKQKDTDALSAALRAFLKA